MFKNCELPNLRSKKQNDFYKELQSEIESQLGSLSKSIQIEFGDVRIGNRSGLLIPYCEVNIYCSFDFSEQTLNQLESIILNKMWNLSKMECDFKYQRTFN